MRVRKNSEALQQVARQMRRTPTPAEAVLWRALRGGALGVRFRRQHPVGRIILDFYCPAARLVIEVDGDYHDLQPERDAARTEVLEAFDIRVIRFRNEEVLHDLPRVLDTILAATSVLPLSRSLGEGAGG